MIGLIVLFGRRQLRHDLGDGDFAIFIGDRLGRWTLLLRLVFGHNGLICRRDCWKVNAIGPCLYSLLTIFHHKIVRVIRACDTLIRIELAVCV